MQYFVTVDDREQLDTYLKSHMVAHKLDRRLEWETSSTSILISTNGAHRQGWYSTRCLYAAVSNRQSTTWSYLGGAQILKLTRLR